MKKLYSIVLMAAALLIGTNAWAETLTASTAEGFENAWSLAQNEDVIQLTGSFTISDKTFWLGSNAMNGAFKSITLDLNGNTLTAPDNSTTKRLFVITHGELKVITSQAGGQIIHSGAIDDSKFEIFRVMGSTYKNVDPSKENVAYYSHLVIGDGVTLTAKANGVVIDRADWSNWSTNYVATKDAGAKPTYDTNVYTEKRGTANGARVDIFGTIYAHKYAVKANGNMGSPDTAPTARSGYWADPEQTEAYAVLATDVQYSPYIYIHDGARLETLDKSETYAIAAYSGGYSRWKIEGTCVGSTGVYVKSGQLTINNATIASNYTGTYEPAVQDRTSGVDAAGSGIVMESATAYAGGIDVTVSGNTTVTPTSGYAVDESITQNNGTGDSKVEGITIEGGTFKEGGEGTISITQTTAGTGSSSTQKVEITGGTIDAGTSTTSAVSIGGQTLNEFLTSQTGDTHATVVQTDAQGNQTIVISEGEAPAVANSVIAAAQNSSINWTVTANAEETLTADKTLAELQISSADYTQKLTIADGVTLSVGRVVLGAKAQIVVKPGAKLIVTGEQGLAAYQESNLVLETAGGKYATFLFNPAVTSNTHPMATVEMTTTSWWESASAYQWENFGLPTHTALTSITADQVSGTDVYEEIQMLDGATWTSLGYIGGNYNNPAYSGAVNPSALNKPFAAYNIIAYCAKDAERPKCRMKGELVGNSDAALNAYLKWTSFANSYTADMDIYAFLTSLKANSQSVDGNALYVAEHNAAGTLTWEAKDYLDAQEGGLKVVPMQAFLLNNKGTYSEVNTLNYASVVYNPAINPSSLPARRMAAKDVSAKLRVLLTNEEGVSDNVKFRETTVDSFEFEKYLNDDVNIYAMAEEKCAIITADDVEDTYIGVSTVKGGDFTISFANVDGREFALVDTETGAMVTVAEGETYSFHMDANTSADYRFKLVDPRKVTTAIENAEAVKSAKGIYTITGQYMGEMNVWNSLPAGVYVVNGEKRVK